MLRLVLTKSTFIFLIMNFYGVDNKGSFAHKFDAKINNNQITKYIDTSTPRTSPVLMSLNKPTHSIFQDLWFVLFVNLWYWATKRYGSWIVLNTWTLSGRIQHPWMSKPCACEQYLVSTAWISVETIGLLWSCKF